jgi:hypothetical protein
VRRARRRPATVRFHADVFVLTLSAHVSRQHLRWDRHPCSTTTRALALGYATAEDVPDTAYVCVWAHTNLGSRGYGRSRYVYEVSVDAQGTRRVTRRGVLDAETDLKRVPLDPPQALAEPPI